jgi:hypothetical protein
LLHCICRSLHLADIQLLHQRYVGLVNTLAHLPVSAATNLPNSAGEPPSIMPPRSANFFSRGRKNGRLQFCASLQALCQRKAPARPSTRDYLSRRSTQPPRLQAGAESGSRSAPFALRFAHALCVAKMQLRRRRHLPATFNTVLLLRLAKAAYAYCVCRCNCGQGSTRQGTPVTDAASFMTQQVARSAARLLELAEI